MILQDNQLYTATHTFWDDYDREYTVCAIWQFERGGDIPDSWHLQDWEVEKVEPSNSPFSYIYDPKIVQKQIEAEGPQWDVKEYYE